MKIEHLWITYTDDSGAEQTDQIRVRRLAYRRRANLLDKLREGMTSGVMDGIRSAIERGEKPQAVQGSDIRVSIMADYQVTIIAESVCDENGKLLFKLEQIDEWDQAKIVAYANACDRFQNPRVEDVAKNSTTTTSDAAS